jgi:hypothetical protein
VKSPEEKFLERFVVDNAELEELEAVLAEFNIFEAVGAVRQELRHSDYLAFLLNPTSRHGLGDGLIKRFLKMVLLDSEKGDISSVDIDVWDLNHVEVRREWNNIDILIIDDRKTWIVAIENKIDAGEGDEQLSRYRGTVQRAFQDYKKLFLFLTPEGAAPSDECWLSVEYGKLAELIDDLRKARHSTINPDVATLMEHYTAMLRRHIVSDSKVAELCRQIYAKHKAALDLIIEHRPDVQLQIAEELKELVRQTTTSGLEMDSSTKPYVRFAPSAWNETAWQKSGEGWTSSKKLVLFEFQNYLTSLSLKLIIGPGDAAFRKRLFDRSKEDSKLFNGGMGTLYNKWTQIYKHPFLSKKDYETEDYEALKAKLQAEWRHFLEHDLPRLQAALEKELAL